MNRQTLFLIFFLLRSLAAHVQTTPKLPTILPVSPEAASIAKNGQLSGGAYNGALNASVPLYSVSCGGFSLPISLNYSSVGLKVDEIPSRVGLNWSLSAGGVITRSVNGKPDDLTTRHSPTGALGANRSSLNYYYEMINDGNYYDAEPDEFRISAPGLSGKFVLDNNGQAMLIPYSNLKIQILRADSMSPYNEIVVTSPDGIKYFFGGSATEKTTSHTIGGKLSGFTQINTGFFLRKIELLNRDSINFYYSIVSTANVTGVTHTAVEPIGYWSGTCGQGLCTSSGQTFSESVSQINYNSCLLDSIKSSAGAKLIFQYSNRPDSSQDKRLNDLSIYEGAFLKRYRFVFTDQTGYSDPATYNASAVTNKRFFLSQLKNWAELNGNVTDTLRHYFYYGNINSLPHRLSYAQDHYGFYNGKTNSTLLPSGIVGSTFGGYAVADRSPDGTTASLGQLYKLVYPTGGYDSVVLESNRYSTATLIPYPAQATVEGAGSGSTGIVSYFSDTLRTKRSHGAILSIDVSANPSCSSCTPPDEGVDRLVDVYLKDLTDATSTRYLKQYFGHSDDNLTLDASKAYQLEVRVRGDDVYGYVVLQYDSAAQDTYSVAWHDGPGVRVKELHSKESTGQTKFSRYFKYAPISNLNSSSAMSLYGMNYTGYSYNKIGAPACEGYGAYLVCYSDMLTSNSNAYQYYYDTNPYVYSTILESEDSSFKRGVTEHVYAAESYPESSESILGDVIYQLPSNTTTYYHGEELATNYYDSTLKLVKSRFNYYHLDTAVNRSVFGYIVRAKYEWTQPLPTDSIYQPDIDPWDVARYQYVSNWIQLDSTLVVEYDSYGHSSRSKTSNFYGNSVNVLPARIETVDSRNLTVKDERKYPTDSSAVSPYQRMVEKNLISPVIESKISRNNNLVSTTKTNYYDFSESSASGYSVIIKPKTIVYQLGGGPLETRLRFSRYDTKGNGVEMSKENDAKSSYIWDYGRFLPIAEVRNADSASIAFTSFESDGKGNWSFSGVTSTHPSAVTGNRGYSLGGGNITKSGLSTGVTYVVSYWKRDSSSTVTVNGSSGTDAITRNGWKLITHEVTGSSSVAISGTAYIDELRLYPKGSLMTTLTYEPMIGATSQCDPNNRIIYYEYDAFGRLALIRDQDRNVVKKICYNYNGQAGDCISPVPNITVKSTNYSGQSGYVAVYTNTLTLQQYTFPIPATGGLQTLGTVPMGTYNLTISKSGGTWYLGFSAGCGSWVYGTSASFSNLDVNDSSCNLIVIDGI